MKIFQGVLSDVQDQGLELSGGQDTVIFLKTSMLQTLQQEFTQLLSPMMEAVQKGIEEHSKHVVPRTVINRVKASQTRKQTHAPRPPRIPISRIMNRMKNKQAEAN